MKLALKAAIATSTLACATLLSFNWSEQHGVSLAVETAQARIVRGYANRSYVYVPGRPTLIPRTYGGYAAGNYYCSYGVGCGYGAENYYSSYLMPGFPASFYGVYGGYSDGYYGRWVNPGYTTGRPTPIPRTHGGRGW